MSETIVFEDMRRFAKVAEALSFTAAARGLGVSKQTLSRRVARSSSPSACASCIGRRGGST